MIKGKVVLDLKKLPYVRGSLQNMATRIAINKAAVPVKAAVVAAAPKDIGYLKASIRIKSKYYAKSKTWAAIVGPSAKFSRMRKRPKRLKPPPKKRPNKTLQAFKKKAAALRKRAGKKLGKAASKFTSRVVKAVAGSKGQKLYKRYEKKFKPKKRLKKTPTPKPKKRLKRKWNAKKIRPARYAHLTEWGSKRRSGYHWLERALARSRGQFKSIFTSALKTELAGLLRT